MKKQKLIGHLFKDVDELESAFILMRKDRDEILKELNELKSGDQNELVRISKEISKVLKNKGEVAMMAKILQLKNKILDHFTLAYMAETGLKPNQVKLVQTKENEFGQFEMSFEKNSPIIL